MSKGVFPLTILVLLLAFAPFIGCTERISAASSDSTNEPIESQPSDELTYEEYVKNSPPNTPPEKFSCIEDSDCVPAECCHPVSCVLAGNKESCEDVMCTMDCRPGTLDCGQGSCRCVDGGCEAVIRGEAI